MSSFSSSATVIGVLQQIIVCLPSLERQVADALIENNDEELMYAVREYVSSKDPLIVKNKIIRKIVAATLASAYDIWATLYENLSAEKGKVLAQRAIDCASSPDEKVSLTYGDIDFYSFANILQRLCIKEGEVFYDIGHGTGKAIVCASLLYGGVLAACKGMEIVPELHEESLRVQASFATALASSPIFCRVPRCEQLLIEGDALQESCYIDWTAADIVFANSTCFSQSLMQSISNLAERMKPGARFVTLTKQLQSDQFIVADRRQYAMSWGEATCFVHIRKSVEAQHQLRACVDAIKCN